MPRKSIVSKVRRGAQRKLRADGSNSLCVLERFLLRRAAASSAVDELSAWAGCLLYFLLRRAAWGPHHWQTLCPSSFPAARKRPQEIFSLGVPCPNLAYTVGKQEGHGRQTVGSKDFKVSRGDCWTGSVALVCAPKLGS